MAINLTKVGGLVDIQGLGADEYIVDSSSTRPSIKLFGTNNVLVLSTSLGVINIPFAAVTDFQVEGVAVTDLADFKTKIATVFPNGGGDPATTPNIDQVLAVVPATLTEDRNIDLNAFTLAVINGVANLLQIDPGSFQSALMANDGTSQSLIRAAADTGDSNVKVTLQTESGANDVRVILNALTALITLQGGDIIIVGLAGGGTTGLSIDNNGKVIRTP